MVAEQEFEQLKGMPAFQTYVKKMVAEELRNKKTNDSNKHKVVKKRTRGDTPKGVRGKEGQRAMLGDCLIKSPSDTTIYAPALRQCSPKVGVVANLRGINAEASEVTGVVQQEALTDQIIRFIEGIRMRPNQVDGDDVQPKAVDGESDGNAEQNDNKSHDEMSEQLEAGNRKAERMIAEAEKFKVSVNAPTGEVNNLMVQQVVLADAQPTRLPDPDPTPMIAYQPNIDDEFSHIACHIDSSIKAKIERGEFVDLEKLLPKNRRNSNDCRMDLVFRDGHSYFVPAQADNKITGIRKWEQAFRVYATIYSQANPSRSAEIWQYVHVINTAASSYTWENVSNYDYTFRQLMAQYPQRSWAKLYLQMWSISMREPIQKFRSFQSGSTAQHNIKASMSSSTAGSSGAATQPKKKPNYCWAFNKGGTCKFSSKCKFVNRCSYCEASDHGISMCPKATKGNGGK